MSEFPRRLHFTEAAREAADKNCIIVNVGNVVRSLPGTDFGIVAWCGNGPEAARLISIVAPVGLGAWVGTAYTSLRYLGWIEEFTDEELSTLSVEVIENAPETGVHAYLLDAGWWRKFDAPYWEWFRSAAV